MLRPCIKEDTLRLTLVLLTSCETGRAVRCRKLVGSQMCSDFTHHSRGFILEEEQGPASHSGRVQS